MMAASLKLLRMKNICDSKGPENVAILSVQEMSISPRMPKRPERSSAHARLDTRPSSAIWRMGVSCEST